MAFLRDGIWADTVSSIYNDLFDIHIDDKMSTFTNDSAIFFKDTKWGTFKLRLINRIPANYYIFQ